MMKVDVKISFMRCFLFSILTIHLLNGCSATGPKFTSVNNVPSGKALVYVYRDGSIVGMGNEPDIYVNGEFLTTLLNSGYSHRFVEPGPVVFSTLQDYHPILFLPRITAAFEGMDERLRINAKEDKTYYIQYEVVGGDLVLMDEVDGYKEIKDLRLCKDQ